MINPCDKIYIVEERPNPTTDLYILPAFLGQGRDVIKLSLHELPKLKANSTFSVVFVRYLSASWKRFLNQHRAQLVDLVFFMDDDLFDLSATKGTPFRYRHKLYKLAFKHQAWLRSMDASLWLSTPHLMEKYQSWKPVQVLPRPMAQPTEVITVFYHGSSSHKREIHWLYDVMKSVLEQDERISFEIIGGKEVNKQYKSLPRTVVSHPMSWETYTRWIAQPGRAIGLAPLLDEPFNHARSYTKFFDITQAGAVGIYAEASQYSEVVTHGKNGYLLNMEKLSWVNAILELAGNTGKRDQMLENARLSVNSLAEH